LFQFYRSKSCYAAYSWKEIIAVTIINTETVLVIYVF